MKEGIKLLKKPHKHKHFSQSTIEEICKSDLQQFLLWYDDELLNFSNGRFTLAPGDEIVVYPNMGYEHYTGATYTPIGLLTDVLNLSYQDALYLLNYFYYKIRKAPLREELDAISNQSYTLRRAQGNNDTLSLDGILQEDLFSHEDTKAAAYRRAIPQSEARHPLFGQRHQRNQGGGGNQGAVRPPVGDLRRSRRDAQHLPHPWLP